MILVSFSSLGFAKKDKLQKEKAAESAEAAEEAEETGNVSSEETEGMDAAEVMKDGIMPSEELVRLAWEASSQNDLEKVSEIVENCVELYGETARRQQSMLTGFPQRGQEKKYQALNDVATCLFVRAEAVMNRGQRDEAVVLFQEIIDDYNWAQAWDPRGWYWSVAEKSQASIDVLTGKVEEDFTPKKVLKTKPQLALKGKEKVIDYAKYGEFRNVGEKKYRYIIKDLKGLQAAIGEGIYPNATAAYKNPRYSVVRREGRLSGSHWDFTNTEDLEAAYFKWISAPEPEGVKLFYIGNTFEKAGMWYEALRAYHALIVHFPRTIAWTYWQTPWYPAQAAIYKIRHIIRTHPELGLYDKWMNVEVENGYDNDPHNDVFVTFPGKIVHKSLADKMKETVGLGKREKLDKIKERVGEGKVRLVQYANGHWQMLVDGKPYVIKGITYAPTKVGQSPDKGTLANWMEEDTNENGKIDGPFDSWVDKNDNNKQDENEPIVGDFQLMKEMGVNTIRIYEQPGHLIDKELLRKAHEEYGFRVIVGNFLGKYAIGSGATWREGTDYENPEHRENMMKTVKEMVMRHKDEPYVLLWLLGNENVYGVACNADEKPGAFFEFANEAAKWIKSVDPDHPIAVSNGDVLFLDIFAKHNSHIDIFASNIYRGDYGFGSFWKQVLDVSGKPAFIAEYGAPAYSPTLTLEEAETKQKEYHEGNWLDIEQNTAGWARGSGNALGGVVFEWMDEWWKNYEPYRHDRKSDAIGPFFGGFYFEEWFGIVGQGNGQNSPFQRNLRKAYFFYQDRWNGR